MNSSLSSHEFIRVLLLSLPLIIGGIIHMVAVKLDTLSYLKKPIHQRWFGQNKTWRGFFIMPLATWLGVILAQNLEGLFDLNAPLLLLQPAWSLGPLLGIGYCLAELPNSFMKRRIGIKEGQTADRFKWFFVFLDQADSAIGCLLVYKILLNVSWLTFVLTVVFGTLIHLILNVFLYIAGIRKNPF